MWIRMTGFLFILMGSSYVFRAILDYLMENRDLFS